MERLVSDSARTARSLIARKRRSMRPIQCAVEQLEVRQLLSFSAAVNFQTASSPIPTGYLKDDGAVYASRGNGYTYGWDVNNAANARDRGMNADQRYDTLTHMSREATVWEIAVPNGTYQVRGVAGDPAFADSILKINAEGVKLIDGTPTNTAKFVEGSATVTVADGRLTVTNGAGAVNNKFCFIEITSVETQTPTPAPEPTPAPAPTPVSYSYLSDLPWISATNGSGPVEQNMSVGGSAAGDGRPITIAGTVYAKGLGVKANSTIVYNLGEKYESLQMKVGLDATASSTGSVVFRVLADGVKVYDSGIMKKSNGARSVTIALAGVSQLTLIVDNAANGNKGDLADWADPKLFVAAAAVAPAAPSALSATALSSNDVRLIWSDNSSDETGFQVQRSTDGASFVSVANVAAGATTYIDTGRTAGSTYYYRVIALGASGDSAPSNVASATTMAAPVAPVAPSQLAATTISTSEIRLSWSDNSTDETSFQIERSTDGNTFNAIGSVGAGTTTYTDGGRSAGTTYHYRVLAINAAGLSATSNVATATTQAAPAPAPTPLPGQGLTATYFDNPDFTAPVLTRADVNVNFDWGSSAPVAGMNADSFSVRWTGQVVPPQTAAYTFTAATDEGARLWIDNLLVVDNWSNPRAASNNGLIYLEAGRKYDLKLEYVDNSGAASAQLAWSTAAAAQQVVPSAQLSPIITPARQESILYVDVAGSDANAGSSGAPLKTISKAVSLASANNVKNIATRIIVRPGTYRHGVYLGPVAGQTEAPITIEAAVKGTVIIDGADVWTGWQLEADGSYSHGWTGDWGADPTPTGWPTTPELLRRREMLFVNGNLMRQVLSASSLQDNTFFVDETANKVFVRLPASMNPNNATTEWGMRKTLMQIDSRKNVTLSGLTFQHAVSNLQGDAVSLYDSSNIVIEDSQIQWNTHEGLTTASTTNAILRRNIVSNNGGTGVGGYRFRAITMEDNETSYNNWRGNWADFTGWDYAGVKHLYMRDGIYRNLKSVGNYGRGLWFDTDVMNVVVEGANLSSNILDGVYVEAVPGPITIRNSTISKNLTSGIFVGNADHISLINNVLYSNYYGSGTAAQITISGEAAGRTYTPWNGTSTITVHSQNWVIQGNQITGTTNQQLAIKTQLSSTPWSRFVSTLRASDNLYYNPVTTRVFMRDGGVLLDLAGWKSHTAQDANSLFQDPKYRDAAAGDFTRLP